jgi:hypothetical protein
MAVNIIIKFGILSPKSGEKLNVLNIFNNRYQNGGNPSKCGMLKIILYKLSLAIAHE